VARDLLKRPPLTRRRAGSYWEKIAEAFLNNRGLRLLHRNFSCRLGEIDLVMEDGDTVVFVEVKYRKSNTHGSGADAVDIHKQHRLSRAAAFYLAVNPARAEQFCRFDVVSIDPDKDEQDINWIKNAFYSTVE
jgi:putative endonuclease